MKKLLFIVLALILSLPAFATLADGPTKIIGKMPLPPAPFVLTDKICLNLGNVAMELTNMVKAGDNLMDLRAQIESSPVNETPAWLKFINYWLHSVALNNPTNSAHYNGYMVMMECLKYADKGIKS